MDKTIELSIRGVSCGACVRHVGAALRGVAGVRSAEVDLGRGCATVLAETATTTEALVRAVADAGYEAAERASR